MPSKIEVNLPDVPSATGEPSNAIAENVQDIIEGIKQSPWTRPIILGTAAGAGVILIIGGVYYAVKKQGGGNGSGVKFPWTSKSPAKAITKPASKSWWSWK